MEKARDADRKKVARAEVQGKSNEVRRLEKALQEAREAGDRKEKEARQEISLFRVSHQDVSRRG